MTNKSVSYNTRKYNLSNTAEHIQNVEPNPITKILLQPKTGRNIIKNIYTIISECEFLRTYYTVSDRIIRISFVLRENSPNDMSTVAKRITGYNTVQCDFIVMDVNKDD